MSAARRAATPTRAAAPTRGTRCRASARAGSRRAAPSPRPRPCAIGRRAAGSVQIRRAIMNTAMMDAPNSRTCAAIVAGVSARGRRPSCRPTSGTRTISCPGALPESWPDSSNMPSVGFDRLQERGGEDEPHAADHGRVLREHARAALRFGVRGDRDDQQDRAAPPRWPSPTSRARGRSPPPGRASRTRTRRPPRRRTRRACRCGRRRRPGTRRSGSGRSRRPRTRRGRDGPAAPGATRRTSSRGSRWRPATWNPRIDARRRSAARRS